MKQLLVGEWPQLALIRPTDEDSKAGIPPARVGWDGSGVAASICLLAKCREPDVVRPGFKLGRAGKRQTIGRECWAGRLPDSNDLLRAK